MEILLYFSFLIVLSLEIVNAVPLQGVVELGTLGLGNQWGYRALKCVLHSLWRRQRGLVPGWDLTQTYRNHERMAVGFSRTCLQPSLWT